MRRFFVFLMIISLLIGLSSCVKNSESVITTPIQEIIETTEATETVANVPVAICVSDGFRLFISEVDWTREVNDNNHYSYATCYEGYSVKLNSDTPFASLYIEWNEIPGEYFILWGNEQILCGHEGFLHEYIRLPEYVTEIEFLFAEPGNKFICTIDLYTEGAAPDGVQDWSAPADTADILVFPTHSDDDVLFFGPLIAYYSIEKELVVQTAFMVQHGNTYRSHERLDGLWEMGVRHYPILWNLPDCGVLDINAAMTYYSAYDVEEWQVEQIRRFQPLVVLSHDLDGEYGNGGHKVNAHFLTAAITAAADPNKYHASAAAYGTWDTPKMYIHLYDENRWFFDVNVSMSQDPEGRTPFEVAQDAFQCHSSQVKTGLQLSQSEYNPQFDCRPFGLYRSLVGQDTTADIMENIHIEPWR